MNGYLKIAIIATILLFISFQTEKIYCKLERKQSKSENMKLYFWRWIHWYIMIYLDYYFIFFNIARFDENMLVFFTVMTMVILHWKSGFCLLNLLELKHYNINIYDFNTNVNPHMLSLCNDRIANLILFVSFIFGTINLWSIMTLTTGLNKYFKRYFLSFMLVFAAYYTVVDNIDGQRMYEKNRYVNFFMNHPLF
jgi:hypothetical protein